MPTFTIPGTTPDTAEVTMHMDANDVQIAINGIDVAFLSGADGDLTLIVLAGADALTLSAAGIDVRNSKIQIWGSD